MQNPYCSNFYFWYYTFKVHQRNIYCSYIYIINLTVKLMLKVQSLEKAVFMAWVKIVHAFISLYLLVEKLPFIYR